MINKITIEIHHLGYDKKSGNYQIRIINQFFQVSSFISEPTKKQAIDIANKSIKEIQDFCESENPKVKFELKEFFN